MNRNSTFTVNALALATAAAFSAPVPVSAQDVALEEIMVTARKREESLQDVGLAVSALSKTEINRMFQIAGRAPRARVSRDRL